MLCSYRVAVMPTELSLKLVYAQIGSKYFCTNLGIDLLALSKWEPFLYVFLFKLK